MTTCPSERLWPGGHDNSCKGKWGLCTSPVEYPHPSAKFYIEGLHAIYSVTNFMEMDDVIFVKSQRQGLDYATSPAGDVAGKSSAKFYIEGLHASCPVTNFMEMDDVVFVTQDRKGLDYEKGNKYGCRNVPCGRRCWEKGQRHP